MPETFTAAELAGLPPKVRAVPAAQAELIAAREHQIAAHEQKAAAAEEKAAAAEESAAAIADKIGEIKALNQRLEYLVKELRRALYYPRRERCRHRS